MDFDRVVVEIAAIRLELGDEGDEQAPVELLRAPSPSGFGPPRVSVDAFKFGEPGKT